MIHIRSVCAALIGLAAIVALAPSAQAEDRWVEGKYRRDGTYVSGHYRAGPDRAPIDDTKPFRVPRDERRHGRLYDGGGTFANKALFGRKNPDTGRGFRLGD